MARVVSLVAVTMAAVALSAAAPTGVILGKVIDGTRNVPIASAIVTLTGSGVRQRVIVDPQGRFLFTGLAAGAYTITATKTGYLSGSYGVLRADGAGRPLDLQADERITDAVVRLWRSSSISGAVVDDAGDPVSGITVQAYRRVVVGGRWRLSSSGKSAGTDDLGIYRLTGLMPGDYAIVSTAFQSTFPVSLLSVADANRRMAGPEAAPIFREQQTNGVNGPLNDLMQGFPTVRVGDWLIQPPNGVPTATGAGVVNLYPTVWHPNTPTPNGAGIVALGAGEQRTGIDLRPTLTRAVSLSGTVTGPNGPIAHLAMRLSPARMDDVDAFHTSSLSASLYTGRTVSDLNGKFTFLVGPGDYVIRVLTTPPATVDTNPPPPTVAGMPALRSMLTTEPTLWAAVPASIGQTDLDGANVVLRRGIRLKGRVQFVGTAATPTPYELRNIRVGLDPADGQTTELTLLYQGQVDAAGNLYTLGLPAGRYVLRVENPPRGWSLKSAMLNGVDISDLPATLSLDDVDGVVVTFTDRPTVVNGTVQNANNQSDADATVLVFPADGVWTNRGIGPRRMRSVRASRAGSFSFSGLASGRYHIIAVSDAVASNWQDPAFLQRLAAIATPLTVVDGQMSTLSLTTTTGIRR